MDDIEFHVPINNPEKKSHLIKILGIGGGGCNAVEHMQSEGVEGVSYIVCNTDAQDLQYSNIETRVQLGPKATEGLGAGADPELGKEAAEESKDQIKEKIGEGTKILFITAGMGGGTGTGGAPVVAKLAKEMGILTIGIVTYPFSFEQRKKAQLADKGITEMRDHVDTMIVIKNEMLIQMFPDMVVGEAYAKVDDVVSTAAKTLSEVITKHYDVNIDLNDAITVLKNSGTAIIGSGIGTGSERAEAAVAAAIDSPLLDNQSIFGAKSVMYSLLTPSSSPATMTEMSKISNYIAEQVGDSIDFNPIHGMGVDDKLEEGSMKVTVVATGFEQKRSGKHIQASEEEYKTPHKPNVKKLGNTLSDPNDSTPSEVDSLFKKQSPKGDSTANKYKISSTRLGDPEVKPQDHNPSTGQSFENYSSTAISDALSPPLSTKDFQIKKEPTKPKEINVNPIYQPLSQLKEQDKGEIHVDFKTENSDVLERLETEPAFKRRNINLKSDTYSQPSDNMSMNIDPETNEVRISRGNRFLDKDID